MGRGALAAFHGTSQPIHPRRGRRSPNSMPQFEAECREELFATDDRFGTANCALRDEPLRRRRTIRLPSAFRDGCGRALTATARPVRFTNFQFLSAMSTAPSREGALLANALQKPPAKRVAYLAKMWGADYAMLQRLVALVADETRNPPPKPAKKNRLLIGAAIVIVVITVLVYLLQWPAVSLASLDAGEFTSRLGPFLVFALLIERTTELFLIIWREEKSNKLEAKIQRLLSKSVLVASDPEFKKAQEELIEHRADTQRWSLACGFGLGLLLAGFGVRFLDQFVIWRSDGANPPNESQLLWFARVDIVLTAALLAGGADPIHKMLTAFRKIMEASATKWSGTSLR
jgi:hypothetical protein